MQNVSDPKRGGRRPGAGRPKGSGRYAEPTVTVWGPLGRAERVPYFIETRTTKMPLIVVDKPYEKPGRWSTGLSSVSTAAHC
jgi:hypothetical protein